MRQVVTRALALKRATGLGGLMLRQSLPVMVVIALLWVMRDRVNDLDFDEIRHKLAAIQAHQWFLAVGATAASFWAIGRYDEIVHAMLRTRVGVQTARRTERRQDGEPTSWAAHPTDQEKSKTPGLQAAKAIARHSPC